MNFTVAYWMCKTCRCYTNTDILLLKKTGREENFSWQVLGCLTSIVGLVLGVLITFGILRLIQIRYPLFIPFNWRPGDTP